MARTIEVTIYKLDELDEAVQQRVIEGWRDGDHFFWEDEWRESLNAFELRAPLSIRNWQICYGRTGVTFDMDEDVADLSGDEAHAWLIQEGWDKLAAGQDCPLTGYCGDEDLLDAIRKATANPASDCPPLRDIFKEALDDWAKAFERDLDHWGSEEAIREDIEANEYEFNENGTLA
jgi:hypothetical protein